MLRPDQYVTTLSRETVALWLEEVSGIPAKDIKHVEIGARQMLITIYKNDPSGSRRLLHDGLPVTDQAVIYLHD